MTWSLGIVPPTPLPLPLPSSPTKSCLIYPIAMFRSNIYRKAAAVSDICHQCLKAASTIQTAAKTSSPFAQRSPFVHRRIDAAQAPFASPMRHYSSRPADKPANARSKVTINTIRKLYKSGEPIAVMTAQDYPSGLAVDSADMDICLVGDSLAMVVLGYDSTNPITVDEMLHHCRAVARGCRSSFLVGDLPYGSYETSPEDALRTAMRFLKEGNMESIKLEGGMEVVATVRKIAGVGIPVMGHIGLTPQKHTALGGFRVQGKTAAKARQLVEEALALEDAGCFAIVLEAVPEPVATYITRRLRVPTIGIGAGPSTSGQVLVQNDMLGIFDKFMPKFCKQYANLSPAITTALRSYREDVKRGIFPAPDNTYPMSEQELARFLESVGVIVPAGDQRLLKDGSAEGLRVHG